MERKGERGNSTKKKENNKKRKEERTKKRRNQKNEKILKLKKKIKDYKHAGYEVVFFIPNNFRKFYKEINISYRMTIKNKIFITRKST